MSNDQGRKLAAEFVGTAWLVLGGCGSAVLAAGFPDMSIAFAAVSLAFGLMVLTMAYSFGSISGCHLNPAVSIGLWAGGRFPASELIPYIGVQLLGALAGAGLLMVIASGAAGIDLASGLVSNSDGAAAASTYSLVSVAASEFVLSFCLLLAILGFRSARGAAGFAPMAIGLCLTLIHLLSLPVTGTSMNAAHATGPALFWLAPIAGALAAGGMSRLSGGKMIRAGRRRAIG